MINLSYAIETIELTKHFLHSRSPLNPFTHSARRKVVRAVERVSLKVREGEILALVGPNGAGKTTLIKVLCSLIIPESGTARINGWDIMRDAEMVRGSIGLVTGQERSFYWRLTGAQNLEFFASLYGLSGTQARRKMEKLFDLLGIAEPDKRFDRYSTGMKQRFAIARSLLNDPPILLMDEPTRSLDPMAARNLRRFIKYELSRTQGKTILFTTHQLAEAEGLCDSIAIMAQGRIRACGSIQELGMAVGAPGATLEEIFAQLTGAEATKDEDE